jgi:hypothetical protein
MQRYLATICLVSTALTAACEKEQPVREVPLSQLKQDKALPASTVAPAMPLAATAEAAPAAAPSSGSHTVAGIAWQVPGAWEPRGPMPMRVESYTVPPAPGDTEAGELAVFFFGPGQGGDVSANLTRWLGQIVQPDGRPSSQVAKVAEKSVGGVKVTTVTVDGTYLWSPRPMSSEKVKKPGYRLLGAIAEAPGGNVFFKLTAPERTALQAGFDKVVDSIHKS